MISGPAPGTATVTLVVSAVEPEVATVAIDYGLTSAYGTNVSPQGFFRHHRVVLANLAAGTEYHYQVKLTDPVGNTMTTGDLTFTPQPVVCRTQGTPSITDGWL